MQTRVFSRGFGRMTKERGEGLNGFLMATSTSEIINKVRYREKGYINGLTGIHMTGSGLRAKSTAMEYGKVTLAIIISVSGSRTLLMVMGCMSGPTEIVMRESGGSVLGMAKVRTSLLTGMSTWVSTVTAGQKVTASISGKMGIRTAEFLKME
jgi:hypothetical protein